MHVVLVLSIHDSTSWPSSVDMGPVNIASLILVAPESSIDASNFANVGHLVLHSFKNLVVEVLTDHPNCTFGPGVMALLGALTNWDVQFESHGLDHVSHSIAVLN